MYNLLSVLIGAFIAIMIPLNGILSEITGNYTSSVMIHIVGLIAIIIVLLISKSKLRIQQGIPLYLYSAGAIGVFTVLFSNISFTSLVSLSRSL